MAANVDLRQALDYQIRATRIKRLIGIAFGIIVIGFIIWLVFKLNIVGSGTKQ